MRRDLRLDDTVWFANGGPGILVGLGHGTISVLWPNGRVTKHPENVVAYWQRCPTTV